jgi:hypothetical protein
VVTETNGAINEVYLVTNLTGEVDTVAFVAISDAEEYAQALQPQGEALALVVKKAPLYDSLANVPGGWPPTKGVA